MSRKPTSTKLKVLAGNPGKRELNSEPQPTRAVYMRCPPWLHEYAKNEWGKVVPELERLGLLTKIDQGALAAYCQSWAEFRISTETLNNEGRVLTNIKTGATRSHPCIEQQRSAWTAIRQFASLYGLNPLARTALSVEPVQEDEYDNILKRKVE